MYICTRENKITSLEDNSAGTELGGGAGLDRGLLAVAAGL